MSKDLKEFFTAFIHLILSLAVGGVTDLSLRAVWEVEDLKKKVMALPGYPDNPELQVILDDAVRDLYYMNVTIGLSIGACAFGLYNVLKKCTELKARAAQLTEARPANEQTPLNLEDAAANGPISKWGIFKKYVPIVTTTALGTGVVALIAGAIIYLVEQAEANEVLGRHEQPPLPFDDTLVNLVAYLGAFLAGSFTGVAQPFLRGAAISIMNLPALSKAAFSYTVTCCKQGFFNSSAEAESAGIEEEGVGLSGDSLVAPVNYTSSGIEVSERAKNVNSNTMN